jgi:regulator of replication initiation timing
LQARCQTAEDHLKQSFELEHKLRTGHKDLNNMVRKLGDENFSLRVDNEYLREQVAIVFVEDAKKDPELKPGSLANAKVIFSAEVANNALLEKYMAANSSNDRHIAEQEAEVKDLQELVAELRKQLELAQQNHDNMLNDLQEQLEKQKARREQLSRSQVSSPNLAFCEMIRPTLQVSWGRSSPSGTQTIDARD